MLRSLHVIAAALLVALPVGASGQPPAMSGLVRHRMTGQPIECLHVALADSLDRTVAHTVTDSGGMFVLVAPDTGTFRVQFELPGLEPLTGPLTRLAAGEMNEQEYPISFDKKIPGELELIRGAQRKPEMVDLGDWHSVSWSPREHLPMGTRIVSQGEMIQATASVVEQKRFVAQFIVDATGRPRGSSWRTITSNDERILSRFRPEILARQYTPARIGEQHVCQLVMEEMRYFQTGPNRPLH